jgi:hypothetical protein
MSATTTTVRTATAATTTTTTGRRRRSVRHQLGLGAVAGLTATAVNAVAYGVARAADVDFVAQRDPSGVERVQVQHVVSLSVISFAIGLAAAAVVVKVGRPRALRALSVLGVALAVVTTYGDFTIDGGTAAKVVLIGMHLVVAAAYVVTLRSVRAGQAVAADVVARPAAGAVAVPAAA